MRKFRRLERNSSFLVTIEPCECGGRMSQSVGSLPFNHMDMDLTLAGFNSFSFLLAAIIFCLFLAVRFQWQASWDQTGGGDVKSNKKPCEFHPSSFYASHANLSYSRETKHDRQSWQKGFHISFPKHGWYTNLANLIKLTKRGTPSWGLQLAKLGGN